MPNNEESKPVKGFLYHPDCPEGEVFNLADKDKMAALKKDGWKDTPKTFAPKKSEADDVSIAKLVAMIKNGEILTKPQLVKIAVSENMEVDESLQAGELKIAVRKHFNLKDKKVK